MMDKRGMELGLRTIAIFLTGVIVLIIVALFFSRTYSSGEKAVLTETDIIGQDFSKMELKQRAGLVEDSPWLVERKVNALGKTDDYERAEKELKALAEIYDNKEKLSDREEEQHISIYNLLGDVLLKKEDYENAFRAYSRTFLLYRTYKNYVSKFPYNLEEFKKDNPNWDLFKNNILTALSKIKSEDYSSAFYHALKLLNDKDLSADAEKFIDDIFQELWKEDSKGYDKENIELSKELLESVPEGTFKEKLKAELTAVEKKINANT